MLGSMLGGSDAIPALSATERSTIRIQFLPIGRTFRRWALIDAPLHPHTVRHFGVIAQRLAIRRVGSTTCRFDLTAGEGILCLLQLCCFCCYTMERQKRSS